MYPEFRMFIHKNVMGTTFKEDSLPDVSRFPDI